MAMTCPECGKGEMVQREVPDSISFGGIIGALVFLAGLLVLTQSTIAGLVTVIVGILIGAISRPKHTELICPLCRHTIKL